MPVSGPETYRKLSRTGRAEYRRLEQITFETPCASKGSFRRKTRLSPESTPRCSRCLYALWATGTALRAARRVGLRGAPHLVRCWSISKLKCSKWKKSVLTSYCIVLRNIHQLGIRNAFCCCQGDSVGKKRDESVSWLLSWLHILRLKEQMLPSGT